MDILWTPKDTSCIFGKPRLSPTLTLLKFKEASMSMRSPHLCLSEAGRMCGLSCVVRRRGDQSGAVREGAEGVEQEGEEVTTQRKTCQSPNCERPARTKGYCPRHYQQVRKYGRLTPEREIGRNPSICIVEGCSNKVAARGYCSKHYAQIRRRGRLSPERKYELGPPFCIVEGCEGKRYVRGYCRRHYSRWCYVQRKAKQET